MKHKWIVQFFSPILRKTGTQLHRNQTTMLTPTSFPTISISCGGCDCEGGPWMTSLCHGEVCHRGCGACYDFAGEGGDAWYGFAGEDGYGFSRALAQDFYRVMAHTSEIAAHENFHRLSSHGGMEVGWWAEGYAHALHLLLHPRLPVARHPNQLQAEI